RPVGIVDEDIARVREASDAAAIIGEQVALRRVGTRWMGLCPFHTEKSPSFSVNVGEGLYYCYGCGAKGDLITFVRETQHLDFVGAVEYLAQRAGIALRYDTPGASREHSRRAELTEAMEAAVEWYHQRLRTAPDAGGARRYLRERGYDAEVVRAFKLGWAPEGWDELCKALTFPADVIRDAGLGTTSRMGKLIDAFRGRVMFPIFDAGGRPVAFGGRVLPGGEGPKYKNSQDGPLYSKRKILYGLNWAKGDIVRAGEVIVCEGYTDVIGFFQSGLRRAVATCGTALTEDHFRVLARFAKRVVLCFDADAAGQEATLRGMELAVRGGFSVRVVPLPPGTDPADDPAVFRERLAAPVSYPVHRVRLEHARARDR
ncbi:MAG TPA: DNA primase, partial [Acidimicrobiales bacterium]|nr:DNA primase [Acidimicrobiales bacterium]